MPADTFRLLPLGDAAWTLEWAGQEASANARVHALAGRINALAASGALPGIIDCLPCFRSLTVYFDPQVSEAERVRAQLLSLAQSPLAEQGATRMRRWRIPVCFDEDCAPDLADVAQRCGMSAQAVRELLTNSCFRVAMLGFLPGFPYLSGLPSALHLPRLATPRKSVAERSIAIAGEMCAAYPWASPGGWRLVGRTPVPLFDARNAERPALLAPGDLLHWQPVGRDQFARMEEDFAAGRATWNSLQEAA